MSNQKIVNYLLQESEGLEEAGSFFKNISNKLKDISDRNQAKYSDNRSYEVKQIDDLTDALKQCISLEDINKINQFGNYTGEITLKIKQKSIKDSVIEEDILVEGEKEKLLKYINKNILLFKVLFILDSASQNFNLKSLKSNVLGQKVLNDDIISKAKDNFIKNINDNTHLPRNYNLLQFDFKSFEMFENVIFKALKKNNKFYLGIKVKKDAYQISVNDFNTFINSLVESLTTVNRDDETSIKNFFNNLNNFYKEINFTKNHKLINVFDTDNDNSEDFELNSSFEKLSREQQEILLGKIKESILTNFENKIKLDDTRIYFTDNVSLNNVNVQIMFDFTAVDLNELKQTANKYQIQNSNNVLNIIAQQLNLNDFKVDSELKGFVPAKNVSWTLQVNPEYPNDIVELDDNIEELDNNIKIALENLNKRLINVGGKSLEVTDIKDLPNALLSINDNNKEEVLNIKKTFDKLPSANDNKLQDSLMEKGGNPPSPLDDSSSKVRLLMSRHKMNKLSLYARFKDVEEKIKETQNSKELSALTIYLDQISNKIEEFNEDIEKLSKVILNACNYRNKLLKKKNLYDYTRVENLKDIFTNVKEILSDANNVKNGKLHYEKVQDNVYHFKDNLVAQSKLDKITLNRPYTLEMTITRGRIR